MKAGLISIGTAKGLFNYRLENGAWRFSGNCFNGQTVYAIGAGEGRRIWAAPHTEWTGTELSYSDDGGTSWTSIKDPLAFPPDSGGTLKKVWQITSFNGRLFCGVEPSALFYSDDDGATWELCEGLWNHPHRPKWEPGYGGQCLHTVLPLSEKMWVVAMSTGGVYRTEDGGKSWSAANQKIVAPFFPEGERTPEFGQCVHKIAFHRDSPDILFLQHHWGIYRSENAGRDWVNIGEGKGLPTDFGFACALTRPGQAFFIPIKADVERVFPDGRMRVFRTEDCGGSFTALTNGLPQEEVFDNVLRDSLHTLGEALCFGTTGGKVYFSPDNGESWECVAQHLPRISCVRIFQK